MNWYTEFNVVTVESMAGPHIESLADQSFDGVVSISRNLLSAQLTVKSTAEDKESAQDSAIRHLYLANVPSMSHEIVFTKAEEEFDKFLDSILRD